MFASRLSSAHSPQHMGGRAKPGPARSSIIAHASSCGHSKQALVARREIMLSGLAATSMWLPQRSAADAGSSSIYDFSALQLGRRCRCPSTATKCSSSSTSLANDPCR